MKFFPVFLDLRARDCLVVGGGPVAARKAAMLLEAGARVTLVTPVLAPSLERRVAAGELHHEARVFADADVEGKALVIAGTDDDGVNRHIAELARDRNIPVNVVDQPELGSFIVPSVINREPIQVAVSTGGASPVLARLLRARLETYIPSAYGRLARMVDGFRSRVQERFATTDERRHFWEHILEGPIAELLFAGRDGDAEKALEQAVAGAELPRFHGEVYLVGAGPGDPDLLTFRALRLLQQADVIVYDRLVAPPILDLARRDAERIYVGKERDKHTLTQEGINQLLVRLAKEGKRVVRLKGGDPFIFGRGGEEIEELMEEGIPFQVVPGITAASGCSSYAGIPLTHRDYAQSCVFVTGNLKDGSVNLNWKALAHPNQTVVFYMGLHGVPILSRELVAHGLPADTPVALVQQGTTQHQRVIISTLESLPEDVQKSELKPPTLIIVGEVVRLHEKLDWFRPTESGAAWSEK
ncbi:MAG: siroheme synthase CysG [Gammaproteobacteria bacterium]|nr:siroheme synthase CysG [Gammaproteobacteria bacterium]